MKTVGVVNSPDTDYIILNGFRYGDLPVEQVDVFRDIARKTLFSGVLSEKTNKFYIPFNSPAESSRYALEITNA